MVLTITSVVPALPPFISGVGDYAVRLSGALRHLGVETHFLSSSSCLGSVEGLPAASLSRLSGRTLTSALEAFGTSHVLLHYSGYGYARYGLCHWVERGLRQWKTRSGGRVVVIFHEVYATGPPWRTSFWTRRLQANIAKRLAGLSDAAICTSAHGKRQLRRLCPTLVATVLPVFSNVGEVEATIPLGIRGPIAIVFGSAVRRHGVYGAFKDISGAAAFDLRSVGVERVMDIGEADVSPSEFLGLPVERLGVLPASRVSAALADARVGLLDYPGHVLTKSGIFAAYLAHGVVAVNFAELGTRLEDLKEGREFIHPRRLGVSGFNPETVAVAGTKWYHQHNLERTAHIVAQMLA